MSPVSYQNVGAVLKQKQKQKNIYMSLYISYFSFLAMHIGFVLSWDKIQDGHLEHAVLQK